MKIRFLMASLFGLMTATAFAQKGAVTDAQAEYVKYDQLRGNKTMAKIAEESLTNAKTLIDKAAINPKSADLPLTFAVKGTVYAALALKDTVPATSAPLFDTADETLKKAKEKDAKGENKKLIDDAYRMLAQYKLNKGIKEFGNKNYDLAYKSFDYYRMVLPEDTNAIYYTALAAINSNNYPAAISNYNKLLTTNYSAKSKAYYDLSNIYLYSKDTVGAIKTINEGSEKFPGDATLSKRGIELSLQTGKQQQVLDKIDGAIKNDPKNHLLYYYAGLTYSQIGDDYGKKAAKTKDVAAKAVLSKSKVENYSKAEAMYKKSIELDPNYFEANLNLGYVLINPAIDTYNAANNLPISKVKEYNEAIKKAGDMFDAAKPYLLKAVELNPKSYDALYNLKVYYTGKKDTVNAAAVQKQLDALK